MKVEIILKKILTFTLSAAFIVVLCAIALNFGGQECSITKDFSNQISSQQMDTNDIITNISDLKAQITSLKSQIHELETIIAQKENENKNLKQQVNNLQESLNQIINELDSFEKIEQIRLTVERLRNEP